MSIPTIGEMRSFFCKCIEENKKEYYRRSLSEDEHNTTMRPDKISWICKDKIVDTVNRNHLSVNYIKYYWECMNCGNKTVIGVWDTEGEYYGDGTEGKWN